MVAAIRSGQRDAVAYGGVAAASLVGGVLVARSGGGVSIGLLGLLGLGWATFLLTISPRKLFLAWLIAAPLLQTSAWDSSLGRPLVWALYIVPGLFLVLTTLMRLSSASLGFIDFLPGLFAVYVLVSAFATSDTGTVSTLRVFLLSVAFGPIVYYFLVLGPGRAIATETIAAVLMAGAILQSIFGVVDFTTGWNLWHSTGWHRNIPRAVGTLANPGVLGGFIGVGIVIALAVLTFGGPPRLRRLAIATAVLGTPGVLTTMTRGPVAATLIGALLILLVGRARAIAIAGLVVAAVVAVALLPSIRASEVYRERFANKTNVVVRQNLQNWSIARAKERPLLGWGYGSFDRVKNSATLTASGVPISYVLAYTSHNTYLTMLVELGALGLLAYSIPFVVVSLRAIGCARRRECESWIVVGSFASLLVLVLTASTLDYRFFSLVQMLPFLLLALLRRAREPLLVPEPMLRPARGVLARA